MMSTSTNNGNSCIYLPLTTIALSRSCSLCLCLCLFLSIYFTLHGKLNRNKTKQNKNQMIIYSRHHKHLEMYICKIYDNKSCKDFEKQLNSFQ